MFLQLKDADARPGEEYFLVNTDLIEGIDPISKGRCIVRFKSGRSFTPADGFDEVYLALREVNLIVQPGR